jgi:indolepyruvate ferredoxin oxidoreductase, alpha subunit
MYRFSELNVERVRRILANDTSPEAVPPKGKPPELCQGCSHRGVFETLRDLNCIVSGDIGCYTLGVLPPFSAMDTCVCMGASIGVGAGSASCAARGAGAARGQRHRRLDLRAFWV